MQNAWVLNQEILINPELYHPWKIEAQIEGMCSKKVIAYNFISRFTGVNQII